MLKNIDKIKERLYFEVTSIVDLSPFATRDFAWKIRSRMKFDHNPVFPTIQDKYEVKEFAGKRGVQTAQTYYVTEDPGSIPFSKLPNEYFIKANHGCGWNIFSSEGEFYLRKKGEDILLGKSGNPSEKQTECIKLCNDWLATTYSKREWAYKYITPKIIVEEVLKASSGEELKEYKFYVFNGDAKAVNVRSTSFRVSHLNIFFSPTWSEFKLNIYGEQPPASLPKKPKNLDEMLDITKRLGEGLDFVRIDLYDTDHGPVLGEMTVYPYGGDKNTPTADPDFNQWLGDQWKLPFRRSLFL